jgi:hypothetical protein
MTLNVFFSRERREKHFDSGISVLLVLGAVHQLLGMLRPAGSVLPACCRNSPGTEGQLGCGCGFHAGFGLWELVHSVKATIAAALCWFARPGPFQDGQ